MRNTLLRNGLTGFATDYTSRVEMNPTPNPNTLSTLPPAPSFRRLLQDELLRRCRKNPGYSLRSFARALTVPPSTLSRILKGERAISLKMRTKIAHRLGMRPEQLRALSNEPDEPYEASTLGSRVLRTRAVQMQVLPADVFATIADWYHYAILELVQIKGFRSDPQWVAKTLGITVSEARLASERLFRLGLLGHDKKGRWVNHSGHNSNAATDAAPRELKAAANRALQKQILEQALQALEETPIELRDQSSMTMAIHTRRLREAAEMITRFRRELCALLEQDADRDGVYQLSVSLFPVTPVQLPKSKEVKV